MATVTEIAAVGQLEDRRQPTTTLEGWRRFVDADPPEFTLLADDEWASLGEDERTAYNEARVAHHSELVVVTTSAIEAITHQGRLLTLLNQREIGARRGLIISGGAATGKLRRSSNWVGFTNCAPVHGFPAMRAGFRWCM